jgi:outer membrane lipoprotein SlyB
MRITHRMIGVTIVSVAVVFTTGCVSPNGAPNNTGTGALTGGVFGAIVGAAADREHPGAGALIGAAAGAISGAIAGHIMDQINDQQRAQLRQRSPQTLQTIQHNDQIAQQQQQPTATPASGQPPPPADAPTPLTVDDIKALTAAGVKKDYIIQEIGNSKAVYTPADIAAAHQANPPVDPAVIDCLKNHAS